MLVHRTKEKKIVWEWLYYYAKHEPSFAIVLCTNTAVLSRDWKPPICTLRGLIKPLRKDKRMPSCAPLPSNKTKRKRKREITTSGKENMKKTKKKWTKKLHTPIHIPRKLLWTRGVLREAPSSRHPWPLHRSVKTDKTHHSRESSRAPTETP